MLLQPPKQTAEHSFAGYRYGPVGRGGVARSLKPRGKHLCSDLSQASIQTQSLFLLFDLRHRDRIEMLHTVRADTQQCGASLTGQMVYTVFIMGNDLAQ